MFDLSTAIASPVGFQNNGIKFSRVSTRRACMDNDIQQIEPDFFHQVVLSMKLNAHCAADSAL